MRIYSFVVEHNIMGKCCTASSLRILQGLTAVICNLGVVGSNPTRGSKHDKAEMAQLVEQFIRNE